MSFELILPFLRPIEGLLLDDSISEIMGNPDSSWWCERDGKMHHEVAVSFDAAKLLTGLEVIANQLGKKLDEDNPSLHAQLPDGSRLAGSCFTAVNAFKPKLFCASVIAIELQHFPNGSPTR